MRRMERMERMERMLRIPRDGAVGNGKPRATATECVGFRRMEHRPEQGVDTKRRSWPVTRRRHVVPRDVPEPNHAALSRHADVINQLQLPLPFSPCFMHPSGTS